MTYKNHLLGAAFAAVCAVTLAACESGISAPTSPSAVTGDGGAASNPDGSLVKASAPVALSPASDATGVSVTPTLAAQPGAGRFQTSPLAHRFQISTSDTFEPIVQTGTGALDSQSIQRFSVSTGLAAGTRYFWRVRTELDDQAGPWSNVRSFTTAGAVVAPTPTPSTPQPVQPGQRRPADPPAGQRLPLPDMRGVLSGFNNASDSCPRGLKYVTNPWQDRVIDRFRQDDTRWGYNAKPTRGAGDNSGVPVVAAGDEAAYHYSGGQDEGSTEVHLVDLLVQHCGSAPVVGWRVFTGEEPGRWTGAGRF